MVHIRKAAHWLALALWCAGCFAALSALDTSDLDGSDAQVSAEGLAVVNAPGVSAE
jgi:hypothetical protein